MNQDHKIIVLGFLLVTLIFVARNSSGAKMILDTQNDLGGATNSQTKISERKISDEDLVVEKVVSAAAVFNSDKAEDMPSASSVELLDDAFRPAGFNVRAALVKNMSDQTAYLQHNTTLKWPMASLTKLLTALTALENKTDKQDSNKILTDIKEMMVLSHNEAADNVEANFTDGNFMELMRSEIAKLGLADTTVVDVTGLSPENVSTVVDLEKLVTYIAKNKPEILALSRFPDVEIAGEKYLNINKFSDRVDFLGGKTGYTDEALGNLASIFSFKGSPVLIIVLGANGKEARFTQTDAILKWIYKYYN